MGSMPKAKGKGARGALMVKPTGAVYAVRLVYFQRFETMREPCDRVH